MEHITKLCADSLRSFSLNKFNISIKSSHAHELVAAYFGYSSRAALLADDKRPIRKLTDAEFIVLTPTAHIKERRKNLNGLPPNLPDDLAEGVYLPLIDEKVLLGSIWPTLEELGKELADRHLRSKPAYFRDQKIQRHGVKLEFENDQVAIVVFREYVSPSLLLSFQNGKRGVVDVFNLKRVAAFIGYVKTSHYSAEADTLDAAILKMRDHYHQMIRDSQPLQEVAPLEPNFADWLAKQKKRDTPLGDLANKRGFADESENWPIFSEYKQYQDYLLNNHPPYGAMAALERAWRSYQTYVRKKRSSNPLKQVNKSELQKHVDRKVVTVKKATPIPYDRRTIEKFMQGDDGWISWDGKRAIPVSIVGVSERHYTIAIQSPRRKAGNKHSLFLDEVRSSPELACANLVTL
ncbi:YozE family protein [Mucilaginibacter aquatilis]|uniref:YozE SAM-like domain-containing protein n=1 Tax=Mucilaginibacter aquatilis TaxID=1517760 RepID=A0A6I4IBT2_9SPHI|nr:hypothetical protein [Mucilaginibacter aquatilis]MVN92661.1 hypothetical protein [Mucilaginibacter aquatilis]